MLLSPTFEEYYLAGNMAGLSQKTWDAITEEYEQLTGETGGIEVRMHLLEHTELVKQLHLFHGALDMVAMLYNEGTPDRAEPILQQLRIDFKPRTFTDIPADIELCRTKLIGIKRRADDIAEMLPKEGAAADNKTYFDDILRAYGETNQFHVNKHVITVQEFAGYYKSLMRHIDKNRADDGVTG